MSAQDGADEGGATEPVVVDSGARDARDASEAGERERALAQLDALTSDQRLALRSSAEGRRDLATLDLLDDWARRRAAEGDGFVVVDLWTGRRYVDRVFTGDGAGASGQRRAEAEIASLLRHYPAEHEWRQRLAARPSGWRPT